MNIKKFWYRTKERVLRLWQNKTLVLYLFFVGVALVFWFLHSLGKEYVANVNVGVEYRNFPLNKEPQESAVRRLTLNVKSYGFSLLRMQLKSAFYDYKIDVNKLKRHSVAGGERLRYDLSISAIRNQFETQLGSGIVINSVFPEDVAFTVKTMGIKRVPIISALNVKLKSGYMVAEPPTANPDSVAVRGPLAIIDTLQAIYTESVTMDNVASSFEKKLALVTKNPAIELLKNYTTLNYEVAEYIDEERVVEVYPLNFPDSVKVMLRPQKVSLKYRTYAKAKRNIKDRDFMLVVDYNTINNSFSQKLEVQPINLPEGISNIYMKPRYLNYMITSKK